MKAVSCCYNSNDPMIQKLGDLKIKYAETQSSLIKKVLKETEDLIVFRVGSILDIKEQLAKTKNLTSEEGKFFMELSKLLI